jgi:8-oxo-dGTP pyrophosphatase MutT (NUDIX family)
MNSKDKVFVIVYRLNRDTLEFLCLKPTPEPGRNSDYYVVTGGIEENESRETAASREVSEEIGIAPIKVTNLNDEIRYQDHITGENFIEYCYGALIDTDVARLNEEHVGYKWARSNEFIQTIWWDDDKTDLQKMVRTIIDSQT